MRGFRLMGASLGLLLALPVLALPVPALATIGMRVSELELRYPYEAGPEGTRIYQLDAAYFSPFLVDGRMVGAVAELPSSAGAAGLKALLARMTVGLRQVPAVERGTLASSTWRFDTPDYHAAAKIHDGRILVLFQRAPLPEVEAPGYVPGAPLSPPGDAAAPMASVYRAQDDLDILRMAMESYRARHYFRYPRVANFGELVRALQRADALPVGWRMSARLTEFGVWKTGYHISVEADGQKLTIRQPERYDPFWDYLSIRPFP